MKRSKQQKKVTDFESIEGESHAAMLKRLKRHLATIRAEKKKKERAPFVAQMDYMETLIWPYDCLDDRVIAELKKNGKDEEGECHE
ncbi:hypothetical protein F6A13_03555 [Acidithiobacillus sp. 'AMD consortium']|uniref:hypothetical protein n=1 Tax=Acidithiobacillus sp. 'AMD consortium' TaxID=2614801 RepID=UPI00124D8298|nr:hypothetical protein [Acidithiobacillus sp. 'AMD consortium']QFG77812.1 hypothetical protein F6A13_03555 [Acidithiobacillus sp. 'AMD consortium']